MFDGGLTVHTGSHLEGLEHWKANYVIGRTDWPRRRANRRRADSPDRGGR